LERAAAGIGKLRRGSYATYKSILDISHSSGRVVF
jgi:hypothetical protein